MFQSISGGAMPTLLCLLVLAILSPGSDSLVVPANTTTLGTTVATTTVELTTTTAIQSNIDLSQPLPQNIIVAENDRRLFWGLWLRPEWRFSIEALTIGEGKQLVFSVVSGYCYYNDHVTNKEYLKASCTDI